MTKKQISSISVVQTSKVIALLYAVISLLYTLIGLIMVATGKMTEGIFYIFMPVFMGILSFIMMIIGCSVYNVLAKKIGGIEFTVTEGTTNT